MIAMPTMPDPTPFLESCPFCGHADTLSVDDGIVFCECGASVVADTTDEALAIWNHRHKPTLKNNHDTYLSVTDCPYKSYLIRAGVDTVCKLMLLRPQKLTEISGIGPSAANKIQEWLFRRTRAQQTKKSSQSMKLRQKEARHA